MKQIRICVSLAVMLICSILSFGRVTLENIPDRDSLMMFVRNIEEVDPRPFQKAYNEKMEELMGLLNKFERTEKTAMFYISNPMDDARRVGNYGRINNLSSLLTAAKKRNTVTTPEQKELIETIIESLKANGSKSAVKEAKDIEKQLAKGKLSPKAQPYIQQYLSQIGKMKQQIKDVISQLQSLKSKKGVIETMQQAYPDKKIETRMITITDTVVNASWRPALFVYNVKEDVNQDEEMNPTKIIFNDENKIKKEWRWALKDNPKEASENFPIYVNYDYFDSHPEFRLLNSQNRYDPSRIIYDNKGNLVAIPEFGKYNLSMDIDELAKAIMEYAYKNNELNIKSYGAHTQHYVKVQAGLENLTAKEKQASERASTALANAFLNSMKADMRYGKNSKKAKSVGRQSAAKAVGSLLKESDFYDNLGYKWIEEVKQVYAGKLHKPYKIERIDDNTFRTIYVGNDGKGLFEIITMFQSDSPYKYKRRYTINSLADKNYFTTQEVNEYKKLKGNCQ